MQSLRTYRDVSQDSIKTSDTPTTVSENSNKVYLRVCQEFEDDPRPACVPGEGVVKLRGNLPQPVQPGMGNLGEIVVLIVVADIVGQSVQGPVVRIGLLALQRGLPFSDNAFTQLS